MDVGTQHLALARHLVERGDARAVREGAGLSLREAARDISASPSAISLWEAGRRRPTGGAGREYGRLLAELLAGDHLALVPDLVGTDEAAERSVP